MKTILESNEGAGKALIQAVNLFLDLVNLDSLNIKTETSIDYIGTKYVPGNFLILTLTARKGKTKDAVIKRTSFSETIEPEEGD